MKRIRISGCASQLLARNTPRRPSCPYLHRAVAPHNHRIQTRLQTTAATPIDEEIDIEIEAGTEDSTPGPVKAPRNFKEKPLPPSPHPQAAQHSVKLAALRSRLSLHSRFPLQTLARTLVHPSADPNPAFNNASLSVLGGNLLSYYTTEWILCNYPRLPMSVVFAAQYAYIGPVALATIASEWGIEAAAVPGSEVDPGLLQFQRLKSGEKLPSLLRQEVPWKWRNTTTHKIVATDEFGSDQAPVSPHALVNTAVPMEEAAQSFVRALIGSLHLHLGSLLVKRFFRDHFLSRQLDLSSLFDFQTPTRDLSRLCAREGFEAPVARLVSETGRKSRHPVFIVGVYSGKDQLGQAAGSSLDEARIRAAAAALKAWYLYRPIEVTLPSSTENQVDTSRWKPNMVDCGEVIV
ncbi:ribonuclease III [Massarina eburnea CBS 473.64]|uniref:Large ribosomal subunit protein mL44 n=1 Tax=Massarina eburnea CBS 473.64 TaxID=1395130 RepID=A0A6A6RYQ8_9PLEO|nr:ribonuclease III [Massarina eburnea CBS 473.64]